MKRAHWIVVASWVGLFATVAVACGDSATGSNIPDPADGTDGGKDATTPKPDASTVVPPKDSSVPDTQAPPPDADVVTDGGVPTVSESVLDFGETDCGSTGVGKTFVISNPSSAAVSFTTELVKNTFTITPPSGSIPGGGQVTVTVTPKPVPIPSTTAANGIGDTLKLTAGPTSTTIELKQTAKGAILRFSIPTGIDFGNTPLAATTQETTFAVTNAGNATVPIALSIEPDPTLDGGASPFALSVSPTSATPGFKEAKVTFTPTEVRAYDGAIKLTPGVGPLCDVVPANLSVKGSGTNGVISVSPASISFGNAGLVDCGATGTPTRVRITNTSSGVISYTASLGKTNTLYTISVAPATGTAGTLTGTIPAAPSGGSTFVEILVQPKPIPNTGNTAPDFFYDALTIDTNGATGPTTNKVDLHQTARGAVVTRSTNTIAFGNTSAGTSTTQQYTFSNTGNVDITLALANALANPPPGIFLQPSTVSVAAGGFAVPVVTFNPPVRPTYPQAFTDSASLVQSGTPVPLCGALPGTLSLTGSTVAPGTVLTPTAITFGQVACGPTGVLTPRSLRVQNNGPDVTYGLSLRKGAASPFMVSSNNLGDAGTSNLVVAAGGFGDITITPKQIPQNLANVNDLTDVIDITPDDLARAPLTVNVAITPQGAIIDFNGATTKAFGNQARGTTSAPNLQNIRNLGNIPADLTFTTTTTNGPTGFSTTAFGPATSTASINGGTNINNPLTFSPSAAPVPTGAYAGTYAVTLTNPVAICSPLPTLLLTGTAN